jgi:uncharacterized protein
LVLLLLGAVASGILSGCALLRPRADPTRFYVLTVPGAPRESAADGKFRRWKIGLKPVELPAYLRSKLMVVRTGTNEIQFADFERWGEPLDQGIARVMKEALGSAPNVERVALNSHGDDTLDYEVAMSVVACEGVRVDPGDSTVRFAVTWRTRSLAKNSMVTRHGVFAAAPAAWNGKDYGQLAERLSEAIATAGQAIAADLPMETKIPGPTNAEKITP